jgi:hypothetical protein
VTNYCTRVPGGLAHRDLPPVHGFDQIGDAVTEDASHLVHRAAADVQGGPGLVAVLVALGDRKGDAWA